MTTTTTTRTERLCNQITAAAVYIVYYIAQLYNIRYFYVLFISGDLSEGARIPSLAWGCRRRVKINVTELIHNQLKKEKRKRRRGKTVTFRGFWWRHDEFCAPGCIEKGRAAIQQARHSRLEWKELQPLLHGCWPARTYTSTHTQKQSRSVYTSSLILVNLIRILFYTSIPSSFSSSYILCTSINLLPSRF
jgi:hypothetical protein